MERHELPDWGEIAPLFEKGVLMRVLPEYAKQISQGDLRIGVADDGYIFIAWANTSIYAPSPKEVVCLQEFVFTETERSTMEKDARLVTPFYGASITISALIPRSKPKPQVFE